MIRASGGCSEDSQESSVAGRFGTSESGVLSFQSLEEAQMFSNSWILEGYVWENLFVIAMCAVAYFYGEAKCRR